MARQEYKIESLTKTKTSSTRSEGGFERKDYDSRDIKIAQLEIAVAGLDEKVIGARTLSFWLIGAAFGLGTFILTVLGFYFTGMMGWQNSYRELNDKYYEKLIEIQTKTPLSVITITPTPTIIKNQ